MIVFYYRYGTIKVRINGESSSFTRRNLISTEFFKVNYHDSSKYIVMSTSLGYICEHRSKVELNDLSTQCIKSVWRF